MNERVKVLLTIAHAELTNLNRIIHKGPCLITGFSVTGLGGAGDAYLYDGESANEPLKCVVSVISGTTFHWDLTHPVDFDKGIYVETSTDKIHVTVCYIPESWKDFV